MTELPKTFDPAAIEARWYQHWEAKGLFRPDRSEAEPFTIVIPPPNVTGSLHIGHALDNTLQDILIRHARLQGKDALWVVGMDHAGIATQMVVERNLESQGVKRTDMSREAFVEHVWEWKAQSGGAITRQLRRLGASCDWANERFTMDEGFTRAVLKVFVQLYRDGLLYRDKRLVNWDPKFGTAISDLEVETREAQGKFWHLRYPLEDGSGHIQVATTRPETMLGDMAVAVHPEDERYRTWVGKQIRLPITGRLIPIIADEHADPELGSGAVKITPGHDFNDFEVGRRAGIKAAEMLNMLDAQARIAQTQDGLIPAELVGLDRFEARLRVVELLEAEDLLDKVEDRTIQTPYGDRSGVVIEPWLTDQWYVDAQTLAKRPIEAVRSGDIKVVPKTWEKTWFNWLENIQPWCVSRQLWWGHQIPAWYFPPLDQAGLPIYGDPDRPFQVVVAETRDEAIALARSTYYKQFITTSEARWRGEGKDSCVVFVEVASWGDATTLMDTANVPEIGREYPDYPIYFRRDADVLDTWFSSALWPFGTLGWPEQTETLRRHYPNDVLVSGFDIIFFWDARMAMQGFQFMGEKPWKTLYLHGLVRDAKGQKMSKSKGNTVDPLGLVDRYGADALRFTLAAMESQGRDIKLDEKRIEGYRNFATKLWNAARFCQANGIGGSHGLQPPAATLPVNRWIIGETVKTIHALDLALADFRFDESANTIYHFVWATFCDWYLELIKPVLTQNPPRDGEGDRSPQASGGGGPPQETRQVAAWVLDQILVMLHPFMPFITEELWHAMPALSGVGGGKRPYDLIVAKWPMSDARALDAEAGPEIDWLIRLVSGIRAARTELGVPPGAKLALHVRDASERTSARLERNLAALRRLARIETVATGDAPAGGSAQIVLEEATFLLPLEGVIDIAAERLRLEKAMQAAAKERDSLAQRLGNRSFVERAKPEAVEKARADHADKAAEAERLEAALARLA
ncbi:MAG TPA: valine--tRNA ligase [Allosphingosinicella sp.]|jgi:valyl-tRNA synthetase|uniref:valine--tRNA ligase n=1 Tax=Allosphingosinicella sp. TaxID=2823234 RepID=UPI002F29A42A